MVDFSSSVAIEEIMSSVIISVLNIFLFFCIF